MYIQFINYIIAAIFLFPSILLAQQAPPAQQRGYGAGWWWFWVILLLAIVGVAIWWAARAGSQENTRSGRGTRGPGPQRT